MPTWSNFGRRAVYQHPTHTSIMSHQAVELNAVRSDDHHMKTLLKHLRNAWYFLHDGLRPKRHWAEVAYEEVLKQMQRDHALEAEADAALLASIAEEAVLTQGRPVTLLPPSRTLH